MQADQYGDAIPDLAILEDCEHWTPEDRQKIDRAAWYVTDDGHMTLLIPDAVADTLDHEHDLDRWEIEGYPLNRVPEALKRWNAVDGFYHA